MHRKPNTDNLDAVAKAQMQYDRMSDPARRAFYARNCGTVLKKTAHAGTRFDEVPEDYIEYLFRPTTTVYRNELRDLLLWHMCGGVP
jgi:hypothetical protein